MRALSEQKDDFVSSVSHELRTPVTSILSYSEELEEIIEDDEEREIVEVISRNAKRLADLVDDILTLSRMSVNADPCVGKCSVSDIVRDAHRDLEPHLRAKELTFTAEVPDDTVVIADELWLQRIINNLLTNAIKFSTKGARIDITASVLPSSVVLRVIDQGPGLSERDLERVFEKFYRVHRAELGHVPGTGLGLPIVRDLLTRLGGTITLESDGVSGTTAVVTLPRA
nr:MULTISPECIES: HAMP domain-containing sensor histidine kinase [unclassified Leucobacter]